MDPNAQEFPPAASHTVESNPPMMQDAGPRFRGRGYHQGPYPTFDALTRAQGDFRPRGRYAYKKRGGGSHRQQYRDGSSSQQQEQAADSNANQATTSNYVNRNFKGFFRASMLEDPWARLKPLKVPENGNTLVFDSANQ